MTVPCTKFYRMTEQSPRPGRCPPGTTAPDDISHSSRRVGVQWLGAAVVAALLLALLLHGGHAPSDAQELAWINRLAAADNPDAQLQLALAYKEGRHGLAPDAREGQYWLERSARNGQEYAIGLLAGQPTTGTAGAAESARTPDRSRSETTAMQLESPALATVSAVWKILGLGLIGSQSFDALQRQAQSGDPIAEFQLGMRYRDGAWSVNRDPDKALYWLNRAADAGNPLAVKVLAEE
jgi:TPR repeat protein